MRGLIAVGEVKWGSECVFTYVQAALTLGYTGLDESLPTAQ